MKASSLPEHMLKCIDPAERKKLKLKTAQEAIEAAEIRSERDLQKQIVALLNLKGIEVNVSRMDKRKTDRVGWPDLTFAVRVVEHTGLGFGFTSVYACAWEVKLPLGQLSEEQQVMAKKLLANGWRWRVVTSVDQALQELKAMGVS